MSNAGDKKATDAQEAFERVSVEGPDREKLADDWSKARVSDGLQTVWSGGDGGPKLRAPNTHVVAADGNALKVFGNPRALTCGSCKYFDLENGRKEIVRQRFGEKLVKEFEWKLKHLGADVDSIGLCGASGGEMATTFVSSACDQYRAKGL